MPTLTLDTASAGMTRRVLLLQGECGRGRKVVDGQQARVDDRGWTKQAPIQRGRQMRDQGELQINVQLSSSSSSMGERSWQLRPEAAVDSSSAEEANRDVRNPQPRAILASIGPQTHVPSPRRAFTAAMAAAMGALAPSARFQMIVLRGRPEGS